MGAGFLLSRAAQRTYVERPFDAHQWVKSLPRRTLLQELGALAQFKTDPWLHQLACVYLAMSYPRFLFLLDMGLGKTKITLDVFAMRKRQGRAHRALVMVPRKINMHDWLNAVRQHTDLTVVVIAVANIGEKWRMLCAPSADITVIDYQGLALATGRPGKGKRRKLTKDTAKVEELSRLYDFVALDESHSLGGHDTLWWATVEQLAAQARYCYAMTGTLFGSDLEGVWSQFRIVDQGETFGENLGLFQSTFFTAQPDPHNRVKLVYNRATTRLLHTMIGHRSIRYADREVHDLPPLVVRRYRLDMTTEQQEHYLRALEGLINADGVLAEMEGQWTRMRQITSGYLAWKQDGQPVYLPFSENPKLDELERIVREAGGRKLVVSCEYTETGRLITERLTSMGVSHVWLYGGTKDPIAVKEAFLQRTGAQVLVMNSSAGGTGVDGLQRVANLLVLFETPSSPSPRQQVIKRLSRPGQTERTYVFDLCCRRTVDMGILDNVEAGRDLYLEVVEGKAPKNTLWTPA